MQSNISSHLRCPICGTGDDCTFLAKWDSICAHIVPYNKAKHAVSGMFRYFRFLYVSTARQMFFPGKRDHAPMMTCTSAVSPEGRTGKRLPWQISPFKRISFMPYSTEAGFLTVILYTAPLYLRDTLYPLQSAGMQGSIRSPSNVGLIPRIAWLILRKVQAAVPVSQLFFASPKLGASLPAII